MSTIKLSRAIEKTGFLKMAQLEIMQTMQSDDFLTSRLTTSELLHVAQMLNKHWKKAEIHYNEQIDAEGCFWSNRRNKLFEFD